MPDSPAASAGFDLQQSLADIETLTGFGTAFHNSGRMPSLSARGGAGTPLAIERTRSHLGAFCERIKSTTAGNDACLACDVRRAHAKAARAGRPCFWICHAGLAEVLVAVMVDGEHVGTFFGGQARPLECSRTARTQMHAHWKSLGHDPREMARLMKERPAAVPNRMQALARMLAGLAEHAAARASMAALTRAAAVQRRGPVSKALALMLEHFEDPLSLEEIARLVHLSPSRLSHLFTQMEGESFRDRLLRMRIERAKELLAMTPLPVGRVGRRVGYADANFFSRIFREKTGLAPRDYRRKFAKV